MRRWMLLKTSTYFWLHLVVAVGVAYAITGSWAAALAIGLLEPAVQTVAYTLHELAWARRRARKGRGADRAHPGACLLQSLSYFGVHVIVAMAVVFALTGDLVAALAVGLIEPAAQVVAYHLHERAWRAAWLRQGQRARTAAAVGRRESGFPAA